VNSVLKLSLVGKFVAIGVSFRQVSKLYHSVKEEMGMGSLGSVKDYEVVQLCCIVCAVNLQHLKKLFKIWIFSIRLDAGNNAGLSYLDIRMRSYFKGDLQNLHLLAIPMQEQHTGEYQFNLELSCISSQCSCSKLETPADWDCNRWCINHKRLYLRYEHSSIK
jgi:hypothetical protein